MMKRIFLAATFFVAAASFAVAQDVDIRTIIGQQFEAFKSDDFATAFTFASPNLQTIFQSPQNFGRMVTEGYPMVRRPAAIEYLELREEAGIFFQKVQVADSKGNFHLLEYRMLETPNGWRINGVQLLDAPGASV